VSFALFPPPLRFPGRWSEKGVEMRPAVFGESSFPPYSSSKLIHLCLTILRAISLTIEFDLIFICEFQVRGGPFSNFWWRKFKRGVGGEKALTELSE
jgi:hypothetical protein